MQADGIYLISFVRLQNRLKRDGCKGTPAPKIAAEAVNMAPVLIWSPFFSTAIYGRQNGKGRLSKYEYVPDSD